MRRSGDVGKGGHRSERGGRNDLRWDRTKSTCSAGATGFIATRGQLCAEHEHCIGREDTRSWKGEHWSLTTEAKGDKAGLKEGTAMAESWYRPVLPVILLFDLVIPCGLLSGQQRLLSGSKIETGREHKAYEAGTAEE